MSRLTIITMTLLSISLLSMTVSLSFAADTPHFERDIAPLLKRHCVKCHGPVKQEGKLNLSSTSGLIRGGETGASLVPHDVEASLLWKRIASDEMPPEMPLSADEKSLFKRWIVAGTPSLARDAKGADASDHWAFRKLTRVNVSESPRLVPSPPSSGARARVRGPNGENASPNTNGSPSTSAPNTKPLDSNGPPHPNPLPPKTGGEGTRPEKNEPLTFTSQSRGEGTRQHDPDARRLSRFPVRRLDAEAIRDALLFASDDFDDQMFGPYIATSRTGIGETVVREDQSGARRRSIYLQHKRTQVHSLLQVFDAPSIVFNSTRRPRSTMPLQSLSQLNSEFAVARGHGLASRLWQLEGVTAANDSDRLTRAFVLAQGHTPTDEHIATTLRFLAEQTAEYWNQTSTNPTDTTAARQRAWSDLCQMLLIGNAALYLD